MIPVESKNIFKSPLRIAKEFSASKMNLLNRMNQLDKMA